MDSSCRTRFQPVLSDIEVPATIGTAVVKQGGPGNNKALIIAAVTLDEPWRRTHFAVHHHNLCISVCNEQAIPRSLTCHSYARSIRPAWWLRTLAHRQRSIKVNRQQQQTGASTAGAHSNDAAAARPHRSQWAAAPLATGEARPQAFHQEQGCRQGPRFRGLVVPEDRLGRSQPRRGRVDREHCTP